MELGFIMFVGRCVYLYMSMRMSDYVGMHLILTFCKKREELKGVVVILPSLDRPYIICVCLSIVYQSIYLYIYMHAFIHACNFTFCEKSEGLKERPSWNRRCSVCVCLPPVYLCISVHPYIHSYIYIYISLPSVRRVKG